MILAQITPEPTPPTRTPRTAEECGRSAASPGPRTCFPRIEAFRLTFPPIVVFPHIGSRPTLLRKMLEEASPDREQARMKRRFCGCGFRHLVRQIGRH